jgi:predicted RNA-binding protein with PIN domain
MPRSLARSLLLVDGYNMIGIWADLKITRDQDGLEASRRELIELLVNYSAFEGLETKIVFDAQNRREPSYLEVVTKNLSVHYTEYGQTADTYIEKTCAKFYRKIENCDRRLIVATSDRAQQLVALGYGAEWMSAKNLAKAVERTTRRRRHKHTLKAPPAGRFLFQSLDAKAQERLAQMRMGL